MTIVDIFVQSLALARLLRLCTEDEGPYMVLEKFRRLIGIDEQGNYSNELGGLFSCYRCLGIWLVPAIVFLYRNPHTYWIVWCLAVAQGASFVYATMDRILN